MASLTGTRPPLRAATTGWRHPARSLGVRKSGRAGPAGVDERVARVAALLAGCGVGAAAEYFFDAQAGSRRRHEARDRALAALRHRSHDAVRRTRYLEGVAEGVAYKATHMLPGVGGQTEPADDVALAQKVESVAFRRARVPKAHVSVNAENGVIYLRGQLERDEQIEKLVQASRGVPGVKEVRSLLHTPQRQPLPNVRTGEHHGE
jgi:osmotically-inducible protein OsmY